MGVLGFAGHDWGAVGVEASGRKGSLGIRRQACVIARNSGQRIPVMPAAVIAGRLLSGRLVEGGLVPVDSWLTRAELASECSQRGKQLVLERVVVPSFVVPVV